LITSNINKTLFVALGEMTLWCSTDEMTHK